MEFGPGPLESLVSVSRLNLSPQDRVLVLGASGWFGLTFLRLLDPDIPVLALASSTRDRFETWDEQRVQEFAPTAVANFAFRTPEFAEREGIERFIQANESLTEQFLDAAQLPSVRAILTVSSGAAVAFALEMAENPYGVLKKREEDAALALATESRSVVIARAWSVSGPDVRRPSDYAFSGFILQAQSGRIDIAAQQPVFRRYVSVEDLLTVCMTRLLDGWTGTIDSGGELIEMGELAARVAAQVNLGSIIERAEMALTEPLIYASDNVSWMEACGRIGFVPLDLDEQIRVTAAGFLQRP